jgi:hypothetical protein
VAADPPREVGEVGRRARARRTGPDARAATALPLGGGRGPAGRGRGGELDHKLAPDSEGEWRGERDAENSARKGDGQLGERDHVIGARQVGALGCVKDGVARGVGARDALGVVGGLEVVVGRLGGQGASAVAAGGRRGGASIEGGGDGVAKAAGEVCSDKMSQVLRCQGGISLIFTTPSASLRS